MLRLKNTLEVFPAYRKRRIKGIEMCGPAISKFRNSIATETSTASRIGADLAGTILGYRKKLIIGF